MYDIHQHNHLKTAFLLLIAKRDICLASGAEHLPKQDLAMAIGNYAGRR